LRGVALRLLVVAVVYTTWASLYVLLIALAVVALVLRYGAPLAVSAARSGGRWLRSRRRARLVRARARPVAAAPLVPDRGPNLDRVIRDTALGIRDARRRMLDLEARRLGIQADAERSRLLAGRCYQEAALAVREGRDDEARRALRRKVEADRAARVSETALREQQRTSEALELCLRSLETKHADARRRRDGLRLRLGQAETRNRIQALTERLDDAGRRG
jgi:hypothetical protein